MGVHQSARSRFIVLFLAIVLIGLGIWTQPSDTAQLNDSEPGVHGADVQLYAAVTTRVAAGENYYAVLADELSARGYATRPIFNWRLPTLTWLNALSPSLAWSHGILLLLGFGVVMTWTLVVRREIPHGPAAAILLVTLCMGGIFMKNAVILHEVWAGLLIAGSLACRGIGRIGLSVVLGAAALSIRELALPYVVIMATMAVRESRKKEASAWAGVVLLFGIAWLWHASSVRPLMPPNGITKDWLVLGGWPFALSTSQANPFLLVLPAWLTAVIVPVLWAGFWSWRTAAGQRLAFVVTSYLGFFMIAGRPENWYWGYLIAPLMGLGLLGYVYRSGADQGSNVPRYDRESSAEGH